jgi:alkylation response protein AidB-like acyl-CoA dehydrogenase
MDLDFSEEQLMLRDMVRGLVSEYAPIEVVREMEDDANGCPAELWKQLGELGLLGILVPEEHGGAGQTLLEAMLLYEELGRGLAPSPHFVSAVLAARTIQRAGSPEQQAEWLPKIANGDAIVSVAWMEPRRGFGAKGVQLEAARDGDAWVLSGTKQHVAFASTATRLLTLARTGQGEEDIELFLVDPNSAGVTLTQQRSIAADTQYKVEMAGVRVADSDRLGAAASGWRAFDDTMLEGVVLLAAQAMGGAERALEITVQYAKDRKQFDKPLGAFQAVSHYLADAATAIEGGKTLVYEAAWAHANGQPIDRLAPMSKLFACRTFRDTTAMAQQVWGGVGFTIEYDIQLFFRRAKQLQITWWDARALEERVAASVLDAA